TAVSGENFTLHSSSHSDAASQSALTRRPHKESGANLKHRATGCNVWPGPERSEGPAFGHGPRVSSADTKRSEGSGRELGTHKRSCPDLKHQTTGCNVGPGPERSEGPASHMLPID